MVISYNSDGLLTEDEIENMIQSNFNSVLTIYHKPIKRYKADSKRKNRTDLLKEYLFCFEKK